jgi:hypothetical protein
LKVIGFNFRLWKVMEFASKRKKEVFSVLRMLNCLCSPLFHAFWFVLQIRDRWSRDREPITWARSPSSVALDNFLICSDSVPSSACNFYITMSGKCKFNDLWLRI